MSAVVQVRSAVWVGGMQFKGRTGREMGMSVIVRVRSAVWVGG